MSYIAQPTSNFHVDWILQPLQFSLLQYYSNFQYSSGYQE